MPAGAPYAPPSFQGIAHTIETVRVDAGHLFAALHRENPFASEARRRLIDALVAVDRSLDVPTKDAAPEDLAALAIPDLGARSPELRETRELIDDLDRSSSACSREGPSSSSAPGAPRPRSARRSWIRCARRG